MVSAPMPEKACPAKSMRRAFLPLVLLSTLVACADFNGAGTDIMPRQNTSDAMVPTTPRTPESFEIESFFDRVESGLVTRGLLRLDGGGPDVPYSDVMLARNFDALAFSQEFSGLSGRLVRQSRSTTMHRWAAPVRIEPLFGASVDARKETKDRDAIASLALRLERATRHPVNVVARGGNFHVLIMNDQELSVSGGLLKRLIPQVSKAEIAYVENMPSETYCVVLATDPAGDGRYENAVAIIRAELPDRLRLSCIHEEIAQGLGLANDSPQARPSIFNDDDEFGRLTSMDEKLLQILYDPRLTPGISASDAAPLVRQIATEIMSPTS